jgi:hypothetical protein
LLWKCNSAFPVYCRPTYVAVNNINTGSVVIKIKKYVLFGTAVELKLL